MTATTHPEFNDKTEALEVAKAFAEGVHGKTVLVTGVNPKGIGFATCQAFASQSPAHLILASRTLSKTQETIDTLKAQYPDVDYRPLILNLSSQKSVREAAAEFLSWSDVPTLDIVVNNAAVMNIPELTLSEDGIEIQFATNHVGHFLFTSLVMPKIIKAAERNPKGLTRVINVTSLSPTMGVFRWSDIHYQKKNKDLPEEERPPFDIHRAWGEVDPEENSYLPLEGYNQGKIGNVLFSVALNNKLYEKYGILSMAVHPGMIPTELSREAAPRTWDAIKRMAESSRFSYRTQGAGASTSLTAALDPKLAMPESRDGKENYGVYLMDCQISDKALPGSVSSEKAERLWKLSEELVKEKFDW
ncbi:putative short-chain dehydrogenase [Hypoxylon trugodes]|uniref:putative short-chain dehydrogenase n=1 Tax=Hypoxylon trugodes TaxID=326681 RepID=UPI00219A87C8|nr:putative short-chain dehydrogenase [Hypoxylon trugodes]KAI1384731.1 putative short-chain dehydrogenase [Hypoxylon trugodes]